MEVSDPRAAPPGSRGGARCRAVTRALLRFLGADGCHGADLHRSVAPSRYRLMVRWQTVEHHTVVFRGSEDCARWRATDVRVLGDLAGAPYDSRAPHFTAVAHEPPSGGC
ncbi:antibiotic biosynthesis monooxygenase family protein [Streptomyces zhihengii]|uniref:antibiotic biosynthesis monooxygenase family protein n=1 Tax=Streptomyces zhihengii TaxID=1818004 RepID=UPI001FD5B0E4|nr:hypothetical protein [Streptomyces zhihengii]